MLKRLIFIFTFLFIFSCGKNTDELTASAILSANIYLSKGDCQPAIDVLEANGRQNENAHYLKVLASAYACKAGFSAVTFFASDLALTGTPAPLGGTSTYSTSIVSVTSPLESDFKFRDLQTAIDILLYAGGMSTSLEPTSSERTRYFSASDAASIDTQLLFMMLAQFGKYLHVYGNGNYSATPASVKKGSGSASNKCFTSYKVTSIFNPAMPATCIPPAASSHAELSTSVTASYRKTRLCRGVVLLNGILNILPSVLASASGSLSTQSGVITAAGSAAALLLTTADPSIGIVASTINQSVCEDNTKVTVAQLETYFSFMYESVFLP